MLFVTNIKLDAFNLTGFQSTGADVDAFRFTVHEDTNLLNVNSPRATVAVIRVRHVVAAARFLACYCTFAGHRLHLLVTYTCIKQYLNIISQQNLLRQPIQKHLFLLALIVQYKLVHYVQLIIELIRHEVRKGNSH